MNLTRFSIERPIGISMIVGLFVVMGMYSFYRIGMELLPDVNTPYVNVTVKYDGASADSVEQEVTKPIENALSGVSGVDTMNSESSYGRSRVNLKLKFGTNGDDAAIDATKKVEAIKNRLPDEADAPVVIKRDMDAEPVIELAITSGDSLSTMYSRADNEFVNIVQQAEGVSEVELRGGRDKEVAIEVDKGKMAAYKLTLSNVTSAIKNENQLISSGSVYTDSSKSDVRIIAQYRDIGDIEKITVSNANGERIPITAFATIRNQDARIKRYGRVDGEDGIIMQVYKNSDANIVKTADQIMDKIKKLEKQNPGYKFTVVSNDADYIRTSLHNTLGTLIEGLITTGLVLFLFLRGWRSTLAVMIAIPTSLISTFFVMYFAGFTFNMMSLMGMTLCIGILVDDSIVVLENITRHLRLGESPKEAAENGRMEIGMAAIAITLCDMAVFLPIAFMEGMTGQFFRQFGLTIVFAGAFSLFVSFTLTPMLASRFFKGGYEPADKPLWRFMDRLEGAAVSFYKKCLAWTFKNQKKMLLIGLAAFVGAIAMIPLGVVGSEYMPQSDEGSFQVNVELPVESTVEETDAVMRKLEKKLDDIPEIKHYMTNAGKGSEANSGRIKVKLYPRTERKRDIWTISKEVRRYAEKHVPEATVRVNVAQASVAGVAGGGGNKKGSGALRVELRGSDNKKLLEASRKVEKILKEDVKGMTDVSSSYTEGMPEMQLRINRDRLKAYDTSLYDVEKAFSSAISGASAGSLANDPLNNGQDTDIKVRFKGADGFTLSDIKSVPVQSGKKLMFLGDVADISYGSGPVTIRRVDKQRSIQIGGNIGGRPLNDVMKDTRKILDNTDLGEGVTYKFKGQANNMNDAFSELLSALFLALVLIYMILAVLYESVKTPFIRMFSLPLGIIGAILMLFITGNTLNLYSLIGILVMDGIVAKNGTLLLDYTLTLMSRGMTAREAIVEAGCVRLKPIFMTTITMIVGMLPTALALAEGAETRSSMAWVIIGGLITSTIFTLLIIPILFLFFEEHNVGAALMRRIRKISHLSEA